MIAPGTKIASYEILALIGAGGMGEVYRARDTRLNRDVAIKVLPEIFARDPQRMARFEREAKLLASLNHPNIAAIYGLEESGPVRALIMELVEGPTLADRIRTAGKAGENSAIPLDEALPLAKQIADAVEYANDHGVIHRDLKPANIKITPEGAVKVLDFGLAKALADEPESVDYSNSPTLSMAATRQGVILGTAAYMSPEQAKGKSTDRRADVWAFGSVLYEMLTGKQAFEGEDVTEVLASVVKTEPDWNRLPKETPQPLRNLLRRCLEKNVRRRSPHIGEARILIEDILSGAAPAEAPRAEAITTPKPTPIWKCLLPWAAAVALSALTGLAVWTFKPIPAPPPRPVSRTVIPLPLNESLAGAGGSMLAFSPDGTQLAYVASAQQRIYLRALDITEARPLAGTEGAASPFFSPDGQWIGFFANSKLKKVAVSGGAVLTLCDVGSPRGGTWGANDNIVFAATASSGLSQVSATGGTPQMLTKLKEGENSHRWPHFLPDGKTILYTIVAGSTNPDDSNIAVQRLDGSAQKILIRGGTYPQYLPTGHLVYYRAGTIMAVAFDAPRLEVRGTPAPAIEGVMAGIGNTGAAQFSFSSLGSLASVPGGPEAGAELTMTWVDRKGASQILPAPPHAYANPSLSPDGRQVAVDMADAGKQDIWIYDLLRDTLTRVTFEGINTFPDWTPDGKRVAYRSQRAGTYSIFWKPADGSGAEERLVMPTQLTEAPNAFSPDGRTLIYTYQDPKTSYDLWVLSLEGDRKPRPFLQTPFNERNSRLSPDGHWLAYVSDESGPFEVYVQPFPGPGGKWQISTDGGTEVAWSPKGNELFYRAGNQREKMMAVDIQTQPSFSAGKPRPLFEGPYATGIAGGTWAADYSLSLDGQRFLMLKPKEEQQQTALTQINVVQNWFEELKRRVPTAGK